MSEPLDAPGLHALYLKLVAGRRAWLSYHFTPYPTAFGARLLAALAACDAREPGLGCRFVEELAAIKYVPARQDEAGWKAGFEQLVQKFAEILVGRILCEISWPEGTRILCEPPNPTTGKRPEFAVILTDKTWLFEVKCPAFIKHQDARRENPAQLPVRSFLRDMPMLAGVDVTLPRDNVLKDFLTSAEQKFSGFSDRPSTGILVVVWGTHMYEAISVLAHDEVGLLTEKSWLRENDTRVPFSAVDGVILVNRQHELTAGSREEFDCCTADPFTLGGETDLPSVWCPNVGAGELDPILARAFDAWPVDAAAIASDYAKMDYVMWFNPTDHGAHLRWLRRYRHKKALKGSVSALAVERATKAAQGGAGLAF